MFTAGEKLEAEERSPEDTAGADTEAELVRRQAKLGALGGDVLAEMRSKQEKRVSVVPKMTASTTAGAEGAAKDDGKEPENPFGGVKLRSTGRASNLTSPSADFSPALPDTKQLPPSSSASKMTSSSSLGKELAKDSAKEGDEVDCSVSAPEKIKHSSSSIIGLRAATFDQGQATSSTSKSRTDLSHLQVEDAEAAKDTGKDAAKDAAKEPEQGGGVAQ